MNRMQQRKGPLASSSGPRLKIAYPEKSTVRPVIAVRIEHPFLMPVRHPDDADPMGTAR
ncbi:MAG: hypothetical protein WA303_18370 [Bradyrhizobium sp.]